MRYTTGVLFLILCMLSAAPSYSHRGGDVEIDILSDNGSKFHVIPFKDMKKGKTHVIKKYLEAKRGENYRIAVRNNTGDRIGVVIAVDGRNIITGKKSFLGNNEQMYIIDPFGHSTLDGWRTDQNTVHRFYFTDKNDSYAVRTFGDSSAMGVIALAVFREKRKHRILHEKQRQNDNSPETTPAPSGKRALKNHESDIAGTGFGDKEYAPVIKVRFEPESIPSEKLLVKYDWSEVLCRKGIMKCCSEVSIRLWDENGYAPYPPGYTER